MNKFCLAGIGIPALLASGLALAAATTAPASHDEGFSNPVASLRFHQIDGAPDRFERATLKALKVHDPLEPFNRRMYLLNLQLDQRVLVPTMRYYRFFVPAPVRSGVRNVFANLGDVSNLVNSVLQGKIVRSGSTGARLLLNTTVGIAGLWDPATRLGLARQSEDFGQTLGFYGVPSGPFLMLPLLGPSNVRDAGGQVVDINIESAIDLLGAATLQAEQPYLIALRVVDTREAVPLNYGQLNSPFEYEKLRYVFTRARELQVAD